MHNENTRVEISVSLRGHKEMGNYIERKIVLPMGVANEVPGVALCKGKKESQQRLSRTKSSNTAEYLREPEPYRIS